MGRGAGLGFGLSVVWVHLAFLFDGVTVLLLPLRLEADAGTVGLVSLVGLGIAVVRDDPPPGGARTGRGSPDRAARRAGAAGLDPRAPLDAVADQRRRLG